MIEIRAQGAAAGGVGEILIFGYIRATKWYEEDVTAASFDKAVKDLGGGLKTLQLRVNSYGGSVDAGQAIVSRIDTLRARGIRVEAYIEGIAASMASVIAQAADTVYMSANAMMMVHKPLMSAFGNADDLEKAKQLLDKYEDNLVGLYMRRYSGTEDELREMLRAETWLDAEQAMACGLCDEVGVAIEVAACAAGFVFNGLEVPADDLEMVKHRILPHGGRGGEKESMKDESNKAVAAALPASLLAGLADDGLAAEDVGALNFATPSEDTLTSAQVAGIAMLAEAGIDLADPGPGLDAVRTAAAASPETLAKAAAYDLIVTAATERAVAAGIKAKGDSFEPARWEKAFASFTLAEIEAQEKEWLAEATEELNAGQQYSTIPAPRASLAYNPDDYKI